jgi:hypothetical protein
LRVAANGRAFVILSPRTRNGDLLLEIDLSSGTQRLRTDARGSVAQFPSLFDIARSPDGSRVLLFPTGCSMVYLAATNGFSSCTEAQRYGPMLSFDAAGSSFSTGEQLFDSSMRRLKDFPRSPVRSYQSALTPDGRMAYLVSYERLVTTLVSGNEILERIQIPMATDRLFMAPDGAWLLLMSVTDARVARVDLR